MINHIEYSHDLMKYPFSFLFPNSIQTPNEVPYANELADILKLEISGIELPNSFVSMNQS